MPKVAPTTFGKILFKNSKFGAGYSFPAKLYISPFNQMVPREFAKARIEGVFFDIIFYPFTGKAQNSFSFGDGIRLEIQEFRDALALIRDFCTPSKTLYSEFDFEDFPHIGFKIECHDNEFKFGEQLNALNSACEILSYFNVREGVDASLYEITCYADDINQFNEVLNSKNLTYKAEFSVEDIEFIPKKEAAFIGLISVQIGSHIFGVLVVIIGDLLQSGEDGKFEILSNTLIIERKIFTKKTSIIPRDDLLEEIHEIEKKYSDKYQVIVFAS
jgi:hypothetical protein